jgi:methylated-DNA-[protein]-cysteine S-methyltransferase
MSHDPYCLFDTAIGICGVAWSERGLMRLQLPEADRRATEKRLRARSARPEAEDPSPATARAIADVRRYLAGNEVDFSSIALDLASVSPFHRKVYEAARSIGWGRVSSYGELARIAGSPGEAREVGQALARNPVAIIIPCHRILAKDKRNGTTIGGFSAYGGILTKQNLLALEGVSLGDDAPFLPGLSPAGRQ